MSTKKEPKPKTPKHTYIVHSMGNPVRMMTTPRAVARHAGKNSTYLMDVYVYTENIDEPSRYGIAEFLAKFS